MEACKKHKYQTYGRFYEHCIMCCKQHGAVTQWMRDKAASMEAGEHNDTPHPYIACQAWTSVDYKRYMASPRQKKLITK